jgi:hypothetical protein
MSGIGRRDSMIERRLMAPTRQPRNAIATYCAFELSFGAQHELTNAEIRYRFRVCLHRNGFHNVLKCFRIFGRRLSG